MPSPAADMVPESTMLRDWAAIVTNTMLLLPALPSAPPTLLALPPARIPLPPAQIPLPPAEMVPELVTPPAKVETEAKTTTFLVSPILALPPATIASPLPPAEIVPALLMPPVNVGPLITMALAAALISLELSIEMPRP